MLSSNGLYNDGSGKSPRLEVYLNLANLNDLRHDSVWPGITGSARDERLLADGFDGIQLITGDPPDAGTLLPYCGLDRINVPAEADAIIAKHRDRNDRCLTLHVGWGLEDDDELFALVESVLTASHKYMLPIFIETHRATITQDIWRTVQITKRFPQVRFNGDFSHYYCGQELTYGDWETKLRFMEQIFSRVGFMHGRIASSGSMQVPVDSDSTVRPMQAHGVNDYLVHFKDLWRQSMLGFLQRAQPGDVLIFAPELLSGRNYYARMFLDSDGQLKEETDRYAQAILYKQIVHACFAEAKNDLV